MIGKQPLNRYTRYQGAIVRNHSILLIRHRENESGRSYWILPGGGIEPGETEEDCVRREMKEETNLDVQVRALLLDEPAGLEARPYLQVRTFLCEPLSEDAKSGNEPDTPPEVEAAGLNDIVEVRWFDLRDESNWEPTLINDPIINQPLQRLRKKLGYLP
jgi:8-oxo-dGTP pyrophosphatase MutT (NUDIX family)